MTGLLIVSERLVILAGEAVNPNLKKDFGTQKSIVQGRKRLDIAKPLLFG